MDNLKENQITRVLNIYKKLMDGDVVNKYKEADTYNVGTRTIQRDLEAISEYLETNLDKSGLRSVVMYDRALKGYRLDEIHKSKLKSNEVFAICKILLDSRGLLKKEMSEILKNLIDCCVPEDEVKLVRELISNEECHYIEPRHKTQVMDKMWEIGQAIKNNRFIEIEYVRLKDKKAVTRKVKPVAIMFSEYYFYLAAFIDDEKVKERFNIKKDKYPTIYRLDRIQDLQVLDEKFRVEYSNRFEEGEFRKRIQFMYGGELQRIKFKYSGLDINAILDRLPTADIQAEVDGVYTISAEVFGTGVEMWLKSQGSNVEIIRGE